MIQTTVRGTKLLYSVATGCESIKIKRKVLKDHSNPLDAPENTLQIYFILSTKKDAYGC